ncbi:MAG: ROK family protein [Muribaculaceae bacterium]|nr:ROK family protein [Muribaculaceae bacterium]
MTSTKNPESNIVLTLDAGGTNFVFSAIKNGNQIIKPINLQSLSYDLDKCLQQLVKGFNMALSELDENPIAISFAFPGPADYPNGIIGGFLPNFPSFRDGVALGDFLENEFNFPVFINNDADLFAYGEAIAGKLPEINNKLAMYGSIKQYKNLLGYTFGTGFGFGFVSDGRLHIGDNSCVETFCLRSKLNKGMIAESGVSVNAIKKNYSKLANIEDLSLEPKDIFEIAEGEKEGNKDAAIKAFELFGENAGDAIASAASLIDGIIVIGGGITAAKKYIMPSLIKEMNSKLTTIDGEILDRLQVKVYNLDNETEFEAFAKGNSKKLKVYGCDKEVSYDPLKRIGIAISSVGASKAIALGAAEFAIKKLSSL